MLLPDSGTYNSFVGLSNKEELVLFGNTILKSMEFVRTDAIKFICWCVVIRPFFLQIHSFDWRYISAVWWAIKRKSLKLRIIKPTLTKFDTQCLSSKIFKNIATLTVSFGGRIFLYYYSKSLNTKSVKKIDIGRLGFLSKTEGVTELLWSRVTPVWLVMMWLLHLSVHVLCRDVYLRAPLESLRSACFVLTISCISFTSSL